jgi:hypothetical protein
MDEIIFVFATLGLNNIFKIAKFTHFIYILKL